MLNSFYLAGKYLRFNKLKTMILISCITLVSSLPINLNLLLAESEKQLMERANSTPLVIGEKGSDLDLVINTLYFTSQPPAKLKMTEIDKIKQTKLAISIPIYNQFTARKYPIVGTSLDYFNFRKLVLDQGNYFRILGDCVIGATIAEKLNLKVGDSLISSPETLFDLGGIYPLKMKVVGILKSNQTADDNAIFTDIKTTWIIQGLGHGHLDLIKSGDSSIILKREQKNVAANAKLPEYNEITSDNLNSFHFHGNLSDFPLTAIIAIPSTPKSEALLRGIYQKDASIAQIVKPTKTIEELLLEVFKIRNLLNAIFILVIITTLIAIILIFNLSLRLRQKEMTTNFYLGCSRSMIVQLITAEILIILIISATLTTGITWGLNRFNNQIIRVLILQ